MSNLRKSVFGEASKPEKKKWSSVRLTGDAISIAKRAALMNGITVADWVSSLIVQHGLKLAVQDSEDFLRRAQDVIERDRPQRDLAAEGRTS